MGMEHTPDDDVVPGVRDIASDIALQLIDLASRDYPFFFSLSLQDSVTCMWIGTMLAPELTF
jgi:hypothetical protein